MLVLASAEGVAAITAGATLLAAGGLAYVTLAANGKRLDAERERQVADLAHDREMADVSDLRKLLDEAAVALDSARDALEHVEVRLIEWGAALSPDVKAKLEMHGRALVALHVRLLVRLGVDNLIAAHFGAAARAAHEAWQQVHRLEDDTPQTLAAKVRVVKDQRQIFNGEVRAFLAAAVEGAGAVTMKGSTGEGADVSPSATLS
jgi:hypothetical protein